MDSKTTIAQLRQKIKNMYLPRKWNNNAKDASMSLVLEAVEVMEHFQFGDGADQTKKVLQDKNKTAEVALEIADVMIWACEICDTLNIDISEAVAKKIKLIDK